VKADRRRSLLGIDLQRGVALLKRAALWAAWPKVKGPDDMVRQLAYAERGLKMIAAAEQALNTVSRKKNPFFKFFGNLARGELALALADRIVYYSYNDKIDSAADKQAKEIVQKKMFKTLKAAKADIGESSELGKILYSLKPDKGIDLAAARQISDQLIAMIETDYLRFNQSKYGERFKFVSAWVMFKKLEIAVRQATFVHFTNDAGVVLTNEQGQPLTAAEALDRPELPNFTPDATPLLDQYMELKAAFKKAGIAESDYLNVAAQALRGNLELVGKNERPDSVRYNTGKKNLVEPDRTLAHIADLRPNLADLPGADRKYFEINLDLKEAGAQLQYPEKEVKKEKAGIALKLLQKVEAQVAPLLPPFLLTRLRFGVVDILKKGDFAEA
ncbi:MAG TPA: hypothetical protein VMT55_00200, partial [Candidatus Sulfotelmatobacter sp.]|nr:hypothetical protein [Candidatus Sulfotelmatobacter sp.]